MVLPVCQPASIQQDLLRRISAIFPKDAELIALPSSEEACTLKSRFLLPAAVPAAQPVRGRRRGAGYLQQ